MRYALKVLNRYGPAPNKTSQRQYFVDEVAVRLLRRQWGRSQIQQRLRLPGVPGRRRRPGHPAGGRLPAMRRLRPGRR